MNILEKKKKELSFFYNLGRICSYSILGFIAGLLGFFISDFFGGNFFIFFKFMGGFSLIIIGFYLSGFLKFLYMFEQFGFFIWRFLSPYIKRFMPIKKCRQAFFIGLIWGNIPCGLVYSTLVWVVSFNSFLKSSILMTCFGFGTFPAMFMSSFFISSLKKYIKYKLIRICVGIFIICLGFITIYISLFYKNCH